MIRVVQYLVLINPTSCVQLQHALEIYESLQQGDLGKGCEDEIEKFKDRCHEMFPLAEAFKPPVLNNIEAKKVDRDSSSPVAKNVEGDAGGDASPVANGAAS